ncbi:MAG TPA: hypothetical protein VFR95_00230 [Gemmatimonadaceae bacterium]|nr:hypothetical protein [Gemmatimonadaceae bacterium]
MRLETALDRLHARVVDTWWLHLFTAVTRALLVVGFVEPGLTKVLGHRFTSLPLSSPVGFFFEAFYRTGIWYRFVGVCQITAALMLLLPWTTALGAILYLVIIGNIFLITVGVGFTGTPFITGPMLLAALYLVCWDYPRWKGLLFGAPTSVPAQLPTRAARKLRRLYIAGLVVAAALTALGVAVVLLARANGRPDIPFLAQLCIGMAVAFAIVVLAGRGGLGTARRPELSSTPSS